MKRLYVLVEGQTEEEFVKRVLQRHLSELGISMACREISPSSSSSRHSWIRWSARMRLS